ncbi:ATP-binding cassette domain-containing protein (plasmid) [Shinella sp. PSBB067]|uniref:iron ABC transporter ATP-binding protein n=1 Tax=Shinella sp. PSBB067 TaxID=2715959 RepID=UPI0009297432|nr:ATP-binding cassette domain-containing protein [Shinella sp. PSBB067]MBN9056592.1 ATP-binding cassette domain-containing protein [Hyphomicrobiales bacterium]OJU91581.1 MAG: iron ABC transporter ATP-binding protein [Shinella sp. 65-6]QRI61731.1 ATP-binding cassette domain-containing protein [Shinella sp. PSBB067]
MIRIENVSFRHRTAPILSDVSLTIPKGGVVALIGPNGAGKSSLLSLVARLQPLQAGEIEIDGLPVHTTPGRQLAKVVAILRQDTTVASRLRVRELVGFGRFPHGRGRLTDADHAVIDAALARFDLTDLADRFIETLSGGQRQRALVAMAFAQGTDYLLLDEPLNNLDMYYARELMRSLRAAADANGKTVVIVLHDINQASAHADRIVAMRGGRIVADGAPADILTPDTLEAVFGFRMRVEAIEGKPFVLHQL